eukprot:jgi/Psemu1/16135/gm1.16135_g
MMFLATNEDVHILLKQAPVYTAHRNTPIWHAKIHNFSLFPIKPLYPLTRPTSTFCKAINAVHLLQPHQCRLLGYYMSRHNQLPNPKTLTKAHPYYNGPIFNTTLNAYSTTKDTPPPEPSPDDALPPPCPVHHQKHTVEKLKEGSVASDLPGRFPVSSNDCGLNVVLVHYMKSHKIEHLPDSYHTCHSKLAHAGIIPVLHKFESICSNNYDLTSIINGCDVYFPSHLWCNIIEQSEITLNFLLRSQINPKLAVYTYPKVFGMILNFNKTSLAPIGSSTKCMIIYEP